jgi:hypothetical protein
LSFGNSKDTSIINYDLKEPIRKARPVIVFVDQKSSEDSSKLNFESSMQPNENGLQFKSNEGKLTFYKIDALATSIIHEFQDRAAKNKIIHSQQ